MKIYFARHGETDWNSQKRIQGSVDTELNENGLRQAKKLGKTLKEDGIFIAKIYTSTQKRAMQTGKIVSEYLEVPTEEMSGLQEMNLGVWEGKTWNQVAEEYPEEYEKWLKNRRYLKIPEGESYQEVAERLFEALERILEKEKEDILIITHGAVLLTMLSLLNDVAFEEMNTPFKVENAKAICIEKDMLLQGRNKLALNA